MWIFIGIQLAIIILWIIDHRLDWDYLVLYIVTIPLFIVICIMLLLIPVGRQDDLFFINKVNTIKRTLVQQRSNGNIENAAITQKIIEYNNDISDRKMQRTYWFYKIYTIDAIDTLTYIK